VGVTLRPRKIVYVTSGLFVGGAEAMLARLVTARPPVADQITVVSLLPAESYVESLRAAGVAVVELGFHKLTGIAPGVLRLAKLIARARPDIVQGWMYHGDLLAWLALLLSGRRSHTRLIWSIRCSDMDLKQYRSGLRLVVKACSALSGAPDVITANSAAGLRAHRTLGYRPRRAEVILNGIDLDRFKPDPAARAALRGELGIPKEAFVVAHVARVDPMKDHANFASALAELPEIIGLLVGAGTEALPEQYNTRRLGLREDVSRVFAAADAVVSSSAFGEGFSNVLAEGMACGLPAISTDVGDARAIVGETGIIVPPRDSYALAAAIRVLAHEPKPQHLNRAAQARAHIEKNFALSRAVKRYSELYDSLSWPAA
jgi:glycosyltransferase involved in cell wall biosynthesis